MAGSVAGRIIAAAMNGERDPGKLRQIAMLRIRLPD
jgi:hypothetical protein